MSVYKISLLLICFLFGSQFYGFNSNDSLYNAVQTTEYANKYADFKYDAYPEPILNNTESEFEEPTESSFPWYTNLLSKELAWSMFIILIIVLIYFIVTSGRFALFSFKNKVDPNKIFEAEKYVDELDFDYLLTKALQTNDKAAVIRFYFLKFLKNIAAKNHIKWEIQKTNNEYYYEIKNTALKKDFEYANYLYNYIWFGKFDISDEQFTNAQNHFKAILNNKSY